MYHSREDYPPSFSSFIRFQKTAVCLLLSCVGLTLCAENVLCMLTITAGYYLPKLILLVLQHTLNMQLLKAYRDSPVRCNFNKATNVQEIQTRVKEMTKNMLLDKAGLRSGHLLTHCLFRGAHGRAPAGARAGFVQLVSVSKLVTVLPSVSFPSLASRTKDSVSVKGSSLSETQTFRFLPVGPFPLLLPPHGQSTRWGLHIVLPARWPWAAWALLGSSPQPHAWKQFPVIASGNGLYFLFIYLLFN